jgi:hypothetical protein
LPQGCPFVNKPWVQVFAGNRERRPGAIVRNRRPASPFVLRRCLSRMTRPWLKKNAPRTAPSQRTVRVERMIDPPIHTEVVQFESWFVMDLNDQAALDSQCFPPRSSSRRVRACGVALDSTTIDTAPSTISQSLRLLGRREGTCSR